jgi:hypothetical protein
MSGAFGKTIKESTIDGIFLSSPGEQIVANTLLQMGSKTAKFVDLFGAYQQGSQQQRWANYSRFDWSIRQLPVINVYESETQDKTSSNAWINGTIAFMVLWPPNQRRSDLARVQMSFQGALLNFFESQLVVDMLDEIYFHERAAKVPGLNEYGKMLTWTPNVEGFVEDEQVPVTLINARYRLDLRAWYRSLEFQGRTKLNPTETTLSPLTNIDGDYAGVPNNEGTNVQVEIEDNIIVANP